MSTLHDKALAYARARKAFLDLKSEMKKLRCTEASKPDYPNGYSGQPPCHALPNCEIPEWCDNCRNRNDKYSQWSMLNSEQRKAWQRLRYEMQPRLADAVEREGKG